MPPSQKRLSLKENATIITVVYMIVCFYLDRPMSIAAVAPVLMIGFIYSRFYTKMPQHFSVFVAFGLGLSFLHWFSPIANWISLFNIICFLECLRVILISIFKYPTIIKDLEGMTEELEKRVAERTAELHEANRQLLDANDQLRELDKMKSAFVSQASHDLRTPLTAIKGSLDNLALGVAGELNEKQQKVLGRATKSVDRLTNLINDILDLSRIETGRIVLERQSLPFRTLVESVATEHQHHALQKKITLRMNLGCDGCIVLADRGKMERVVGELINNAIKYTPEGGTVEVLLTPTDQCVILQVADSGIGMTPEECRMIWDRFYRTPSSQQMAKGSGLGLSIVKELVELHQGVITVESAPGRGTAFRMTLPRNLVEEEQHVVSNHHDRG